MKVDTYGEVDGTIQAIHERLYEQPLTMAMSADPEKYAYYSGGVIEPDSQYCSVTINHTVTLVGYQDHYHGEREGRDTNLVCRKRRVEDSDYRSGCKYRDEFK